MTRAIHNGIAKPGQARARAQAIQCFIFGAKFYPGHPPEIQCALPLKMTWLHQMTDLTCTLLHTTHFLHM